MFSSAYFKISKKYSKIEKLEVQSDKSSMVYKAIIMDIFAVDSEGTLYNIEVQKANKGADHKRARYHSSIMDTHVFKKGQTAKDLPNTYVIFITENDVLGKDKIDISHRQDYKRDKRRL